MQIGLDCDGTVVSYAVCTKSGACDGRIIAQTETLKGAEHELSLAIGRAKRVALATDTKFWIMKRTFSYERVLEVIPE